MKPVTFTDKRTGQKILLAPREDGIFYYQQFADLVNQGVLEYSCEPIRYTFSPEISVKFIISFITYDWHPW